MLDVFSCLKALVKRRTVYIDGPVFKLHYSATVAVLTAFSIIVTMRQYVGNPIDCVHTSDIPGDVLSTFCWIHSTFTVIYPNNRRLPYYGVQTSYNPKDRKMYKYYQWVCFCLFFQVSPKNYMIKVKL